MFVFLFGDKSDQTPKDIKVNKVNAVLQSGKVIKWEISLPDVFLDQSGSPKYLSLTSKSSKGKSELLLALIK